MDLGLDLSGVAARRISEFSPLDLPNLRLWLDASDASSITLNGSNVQRWGDKSGNGNHFDQLTPAYQPAYVSDVKNGNNSILFDGIGHRLDCLNNFVDFSDVTMFVAALFDDSKARGYIWHDYGTPTWKVLSIERFDTAETGVFARDNDQNFLYPKIDTESNVHALSTFKKGTNFVTLGNNGVNYFTTTGTLNPTTYEGDNLPIVGAGRFAGGGAYEFFFKGYIDEIIVVEGFPEDYVRAEVDEYLKIKWVL